MNGWIQVHRCITEHWIWQDALQGFRWIDLLILATWRSETRYHRSNRIDLKRGQIAISIRGLARRWKTNNRVASSFITLLESAGMIKCDRSNPSLMIITICGYDKTQKEATKNQVPDDLELNPIGIIPDPEEEESGGGQPDGAGNGLQPGHHNMKNKKNIINNNSSSSSSREEKQNFFVEKFKADTKVLARAVENLGCSQEKILEMLKLYSNEMIITDEDAEDYSAFKTHFYNWARKHLEINKKKENGNGKQKSESKSTGGGKNDDRFSPRRGTDPGSHASHDFKGKF